MPRGPPYAAGLNAPGRRRHHLRSVPDRVRERLPHFQYDNSTFKVNWSLDAPIPWSAEPARRASTVHVAEGIPGLTRSSVQLNEREIPDRPFLILGQCSMADPTRSPQGTETAWAYTHTPQQPLRDAAGEIAGDWSDPAQVEAFAPTSPPPPPTPAAASTAARAATRQRPPCGTSAPSASSASS